MPRYWKTRNRIEKAVYDTGINVALYYVENSKWYKKFLNQTRVGLFKQIEHVATEENVNNLLMFTKTILEDNVTSYIISVSEFINLTEFLNLTGREGGQAAVDKLGIDGTFVLKNQKLIDYFDDHSRLIINSVDSTTKEWVARQIQFGKDNLMSPREIVDLLIDEGKAISKVRAERIVLTETANAMMVVELETAKRNGIVEAIWRTSIDDRVCPICLPLEGSKVKIGQNFGGGVAHPPAHVNCRCFVEEVIPDDWDSGEGVWLGE